MVSWFKKKKPPLGESQNRADAWLSLSEDAFADFSHRLLGQLDAAHAAMFIVAYWNSKNFQIVARERVPKVLDFPETSAGMIRYYARLQDKNPENEIAVRRCGWFLHAAVLMHLENLSFEGTRFMSEILSIWSRTVENSPQAAYFLSENILWRKEEKEPFIITSRDKPEFPDWFVKVSSMEFAAHLPPKFVQDRIEFQKVVSRIRGRFIK
jgi:hypothetical protein